MTGLGIDISGRALKLIELRRGGGGISLHKKACVLNTSDLQADLNQLVAEHKLKARKAVTAITGDTAFVRFMKVLPVSRDKLCRTIEFEIEQQLPFPISEVGWDYHIVGGVQEGGELDVITAAAKREKIEEFIAPMKNAGLRLSALDILPFALFNCAYFNGEFSPDKLTALVNIGLDTTDVVICIKDKGIWARSFPMGSESIKGTTKIEDLVEEIVHSIEYYFSQNPDRASPKIEGLLLSGEGATSENLERILTERLSTSLRLLNPFKRISISQGQQIDQAHIYGVAVGLALRQMSRAHLKFDLLKEDRAQVCEARQGRIFKIASGLILAAIVASVSFFSRSDYNFKRLRLMRMESLLETYRKYEPHLKRLDLERGMLASKVKALYGLIQRRDELLNALSLIRSFLTTDMWITNYTGALSVDDESRSCSINITGRSLSYKSVNDFISALKRDARFKNAKPKSSSFIKDLAGEEIVEFSVSVDVL